MLLVGSGVAGHAQRMGLQELPALQPGGRPAIAALPEHGLIRLRAETIDAARMSPAANAARIRGGLARLGVRAAEPTYYLVHSRMPMDAGTLAALAARGGQVVSSVSGHTCVVRGNQAALQAMRGVRGVDLVTLYQPAHRISPELVARLRSAPPVLDVYVLLFSDQDPWAVVRDFGAMGGDALGVSDSPYGPLLRMRFPGGAVASLANVPGVQWVEEYAHPRLANDAATGFETSPGVRPPGIPSGGIMNIKPVWDQGLTGTGQTVGHADTGLDSGVNDTSTMHPDFQGRIAAAFGWGTANYLGWNVGSGSGSLAGTHYEAQKFVPSSSGNLVAINLYLMSQSGTGTNSGTIGCAVYSDSGGVPGSVLANGVGSPINANQLVTAGFGKCWTAFNGLAVAAGTTYWIVLDFSTCVGGVYAYNIGSGVGVHRTSSNGTTWSGADPQSWHFEARGSGTWSDPDGHGTHTAGSILGDGAASPTTGQFRGPAYQAALVHQSLINGSNITVPDDISSLFGQAYLLGAHVHSNSWVSAGNGSYNAQAMQLDAFAWNNLDMLVCFAAGNGGVDTTPGDGVVDSGSVVPPATAKNCLTVGACESVRSSPSYRYSNFSFAYTPLSSDYVSNNYGGMAAFSGRGPCLDGRIKPEVVAPGTNIVSCWSRQSGVKSGWGAYDTYYKYSGGTSMACPLVAGAAALARQFFVERKNRNPSAALLKATLVHGATDMPGQYATSECGSVPNHNEGWGRVNLYNSLFPTATTYFTDATPDNGMALTTGQLSMSATVAASSQSLPLRATLVWTDPPSNPAGTGGLINDLNLRIYRRNAGNTADEATYYPKLVGGTTGNDSTNNVEQVEVAGGALVAGRTYRVEVSASALNATYSTQPFALIVSGDFVSPTPVTVTDGRAERHGEGVSLSWRVDDGADAAAFNILRSPAPEGPFTRVNPKLLVMRPGQEQCRFQDRAALAGESYYHLEIVTATGARERFGPIRCAPGADGPLPPSRRASARR